MLRANKELGVQDFAPELVLFGGDGAGEAFAFDKRVSPPTIVMVPLIGPSLDAAIPQGAGLAGFVRRLRVASLFDASRG